MQPLLTPLAQPLTCEGMFFFFLADPDNPFRKSMVFNILTRVGENASISCLATDPSLDNLRLETCSSSALAPGLQYSASLEQGVLIHDTQKAYEGCYVCTGKLREKHIRSHDYHLTVIPGKAVELHVCTTCPCTNVPSCAVVSFQSLLLLLWLRCRPTKEWSSRATRASLSPATLPMSMETSSCSGWPRLARWGPSAFSLLCAVLLVEDWTLHICWWSRFCVELYENTVMWVLNVVFWDLLELWLLQGDVWVIRKSHTLVISSLEAFQFRW